jgi:hypothetical protein
MATRPRGSLARAARLGRYLVEDAGGLVVDIAYGARDALTHLARVARRQLRRVSKAPPRRG